MASTTANGTSKDPNGLYSKIANSTSSQNKSSFSQKIAERKNEEEGAVPVTAMSQKSTGQPQKAWTGVNPITQRSNSQVNGPAKPAAKSQPSSAALSKSLVERHNWVWNVSVGATCTITTQSNEVFTGILSGLQKAKDSNQQQFCFKMVKDEAQEYLGQDAEHFMVFSISDVLSIEIPEGQSTSRSTNGSSKFRTDVDISGNLAQRERNLQRWEAPTGSFVDGALESGADSSGGWDQFKANERLFGLKTDYDENIYTTTIDRGDPHYLAKERKAAQLAHEIESSTSVNAHIREERGLDDSGLDEETKYSGVVRNYEPLASNQPGRYVPPSRRQPTVASNENFVDPAIISSQIARPKSGTPQEKSPAKEDTVTEAKSEQVSVTRRQPEAVNVDSLGSRDSKPMVPMPNSTHPSGPTHPSATANVEYELLDSFKQFSALEKIRIQDHRRNKASQDKAIKLNDLKKFSQNFKLCTPVPKDLIPILAKDEAKQKALVEKAQKNADTIKPSERGSSTLVDPQSQRRLAVARWENGSPMGDQSKLKGVPIPSGQMAKGTPSTRPMPGLSTRLQESHRAHKVATGAPVQPSLQTSNLPRGPSGSSPTKTSSVRSPSSATNTKFNVKAMEFKPNPTASTFKPITALTSPVPASRSGSATRKTPPVHVSAKFFEQKAFGNPEGRKTILDISKAEKSGDSTQNSGFTLPFKAFPTWVAPPKDGEPEIKYTQAFEKYRTNQTSNNATAPIPQVAHQHQLPFNLQNNTHHVPQVHAPQGMPHVQGHAHHFAHPPHFDDHHMRSAVPGTTAYASPSPRMHNTSMVFPAPIPPQGQMFGGPVQYVVPGQPQMGARQYSNGPHPMTPGPQGHLAPMMVQQHSQSGYVPQQMAIPYGVVYAAPPQPGYPPAQHPNGYPSPGRAAPMMMHSTSHQGHQPQFVPANQFAQPLYSPQPPSHVRAGFGSPQPTYTQQPYQQHHYSHQPRRTPSTAGYGHPHQMQHVIPQAPQMNGAMEEDAK